MKKPPCVLNNAFQIYVWLKHDAKYLVSAIAYLYLPICAVISTRKALMLEFKIGEVKCALKDGLLFHASLSTLLTEFKYFLDENLKILNTGMH